MTNSRMVRYWALAAGLALLGAPAYGAATITIVNGNAAGVGFNDPTVAVPVGGNPGTTLGQQRLNAFQAAANIWGATITSSVNIRVLATMEPLTCTPTGAVLGSAGSTLAYADFPGAPIAGALYGKALTSKLYGADADPSTADIRARFNSNLGQPGCLTGTFFYLGLDNNHGSDVDMVAVLLHEFAHGLGFQTFTNGANGAQLAGYPSAWDYFLLDRTSNKLWKNMTNAERATSSLRPLVWTGPNVATAAPSVLSAGTPLVRVTSPSSVANNYRVGTASFGPALASPGVSGAVAQIVDTPGNLGLVCGPLAPAAAAAVNGKIALIDRGTCTFIDKVKRLQNAGAIGAIIADNVAGSPPPGLTGADPTITIPSVRITQADGLLLKAAIAQRSRTSPPMLATLGVDLSVMAGADPAGRVLMYTPNPYQGGSSISHFDVSGFPNLLMEPAINGDLTHSVIPPQDLTFRLLQDIGW